MRTGSGTLAAGGSSTGAGSGDRPRFAPRGALALLPSAYGLEIEVSGEVEEAPAFVEVGGVAVVRVDGPLGLRACLLWDGYDAILERVRLALASGCSGVVLAIDSPGGMVAGCFEAARELRAMARAASKPLIGFVDGNALSAAYAIASQCDRVVAPASAYVGSVGVIELMHDCVEADRAFGSRFAVVTSGARKADGNPHVQISKEAMASTQRRVDALGAMFCALVEEGRGVAAAAVAALECDVFVGAEAVRLGLADAVGTMADALALAAGVNAGASVVMSAAKGPEVIMDEDEKKAVEALRALVKAGGSKAKGAKAALAAMGADGEEPPKDDGGDVAAEGEEEEPTAEGEPDEEPAAECEEEPPPPKARRAAAAAGGAKASAAESLAAKLVELDRRVRAQETRAERTRLLASRPDLMAQAEVKAWLSAAPIEEVRRAVKAIPRAARPNPAAAQAVQATRGERQVDAAGAGAVRSDRSPREVAEKLDAKMGFAPRAPRVERQGRAVVFRPMTPEEARSLGKGEAR